MSVFSQYKNKHRGRDVVVLGSGASLKKYKPIKDAIHIGVNSTIFAGVDLDYTFIQDPGNTGNPNSYVSRQAEYDCHRPRIAKFYGGTLSDMLKKNAPKANAFIYDFSSNALVLLDNGAKVENPDAKPYFSSNLDQIPPASAGSISFPALQFALWTGAKRVFLVGMDVTDPRRFNEVPGQNGNDYVAQYHLKRWQQFAQWAGEVYDEVRIISINPVSMGATANGARSRCNFPASIFDKSRISLIRVNRCSPLR